MIIAKTHLEKIPDNCWVCEYLGCSLACKARQPEQMKKAYKTKRHKDCPLKGGRPGEDSAKVNQEFCGLQLLSGVV